MAALKADTDQVRPASADTPKITNE
jgi:hypothetical protein